jgi:Cu-processing system permease protein
MNINNVYVIAKKEFVSNIKNYWFLLSSVIFCFLNFIIIYFGEIISGDYSQTDIRALSLSIIHLQMYLIPLFSFILSYDAILSERESGVLDLILSYRVTLLDVMFGKLLGNCIVFTISFLLGFLPVFLYLYFLGVKFLVLFKFVFISIWLSFIFNSFALYVSNASKDRTFVILLSIFIWLFFIFVYDIIFTFFVVLFYGSVSNYFLNFLLFFNPAEMFRLISIFYFIPNDITDLFGINVSFLNNFYVFLSMFIWFVFVFFSFLFFYFKKK